MAQESSGLREAFAAFALSLEEERYYDAHEDLEPVWYLRRFEDDNEVRLLKGFINAAVSFELLKRGRPQPSHVAWTTYLKYRPLLETLVTPRKELYVTISQLIEYKYANLV